MKKNELDKDQGLRLAVQHKNEAAERMTLLEDFTDRLMQRIGQQDEQPKRRHYWTYIGTAIAVAASIALLMVIHFDKDATGEQPSLIAQTDTTQTTIKKVEKLPVQKVKNTEAADSVKEMKEQLRMPRPPRHYMAKASPSPSQGGGIEIHISPSSNQTPPPWEGLGEAFDEERRQIEMEMMTQMSGSLQADFKGLTNEIRSRGERMSQQVVMALNEDE